MKMAELLPMNNILRLVLCFLKNHCCGIYFLEQSSHDNYKRMHNITFREKSREISVQKWQGCHGQGKISGK